MTASTTPAPTPIPDPRSDAELLAAHRALDAQVQQCRHDMGAILAIIESRIPAPVHPLPPAVAPSSVGIVPIPPTPPGPVVTLKEGP